MEHNLELVSLLKELIPDLKCELEYKTIYQLLVAVVLSAQCTDKRVNTVTPVLFAKYPDAISMSSADVKDIEEIIRPCGTYRIKAKNLILLSQKLVSDFGGKVPKTIDELITLAGVGRKTASVVLAEGYKIPAFPVDTHVLRVTNRLGLVKSNDPLVVEKQMKALFPKELWIDLHYLLVLFGRYHCKAIGYRCGGCTVKHLCQYKSKNL